LKVKLRFKLESQIQGEPTDWGCNVVLRVQPLDLFQVAKQAIPKARGLQHSGPALDLKISWLN
jgi:hypothetical protein